MPIPRKFLPRRPAPRRSAVLVVLVLLAGCAHSSAPPPPPRATALPPPAISGPAASQGELPPGLIAACRTEAERATVVQNRGEMMRLDEAENRGVDSLMQNQQERNLMLVRRDRLFRECLARNRTTPPGQVAIPR